MAHIEIVIGPMYSGKSTELIRRCNNYEAIYKKVLLFNHTLDTRCESDSVQTHKKITKFAVKTTSLLTYFYANKTELLKNHVIAIDEAQFFDDLFEFICLIEGFDIVIIIAGLDGDCFRKPFGQILQCIPYADRVTKLNAFCMMRKDGTFAAFTKRLPSLAPQSGQIDIGATDKYLAVCRQKYLA
jgi:thymidine kinase